MTAVAGVNRWIDFQVANQRVRRNGQPVSFVKSVQTATKSVGTSHFVVARNPRVRQCFAIFLEHFQTQLVAGTIPNFFWHTRLLASLLVLRPFFGKKKSYIDQYVFVTRNISHVNSHMTVVGLTQPIVPLSRRPDRLRAPIWQPPKDRRQSHRLVHPTRCPPAKPTRRAMGRSPNQTLR